MLRKKEGDYYAPVQIREEVVSYCKKDSYLHSFEVKGEVLFV